MGNLRDHLSSLESRPWQRGAWQGMAIGLGVGIGGVIAGRSLLFVVASTAGVALAMALVFGFLLRVQIGRGRPTTPGRRR